MRFEKRATSKVYEDSLVKHKIRTALPIVVHDRPWDPETLYAKDSSVVLHTDGRTYICRHNGRCHAPSLTSSHFQVIACEGAAGQSFTKNMMARAVVEQIDKVCEKLFADFIQTAAIESEVAMNRAFRAIDESLGLGSE